MAQTIKIKRSATSGNKLTGSNSIAGEIGMNTADKSLYIQTGSTDASVVTVYDDSILHLDDTNNRVGIGTTSPTKFLHLSYNSSSTSHTGDGLAGGAAGGGLLIQNTNTTNNTYANLDFRAVTADGRIVYQYTGTQNQGDFHFITDNTNSPAAAMTIKNDGNVGIGTTAPSKPLHVVGGAVVTGDLQVEGGDIEFNQSSGQARIRNLLQDTYMRFSVNVGGTQTNAINIRGNNGYVGIGSAESGNSPAYPLDVYNAGADTVGRFTSGDNRARILVADNDTLAYIIAEDSKMSLGLTSSLDASNLNIQSNGNVGIGTTSPSEKLHVDGNIRLQGTNSLALNTNGSLKYSSSAGAVLLSNASSENVKIRTASNANAGDIIFETNDIERIRILGSNGNVGIGTTAPDFSLDVKGPAGAHSAGDNIIGVFRSSTDHATYLKVKNTNTNTTAAATRAGIDLDVANHADSARARAQFVLRSINGSDVGGDTNISVPRDLRFLINNESTLTASSGEQASSSVVAGTEIMRITSTGNVGIGNTSPGEKLEVTGTIKQTGTYNLTLSGGANITGSNHVYIKGNNSYVRIDAPNNSIYYNAGTDHVFGNGNGSTEYMRIDTNGTNAGNVGIGISAPTTPLAVQSNSSAQGITILGRSSDDISQLDFVENDGTSVGGFQARTTDFRVRSVSNIPLLFMTNNTERARIDTNGSVFIASTSDSGSNRHYFQHDGFFRHVRSGQLVGVLDRLSSDGDIFKIRKDGSDIATLGSNQTQFLIDSNAGNIVISANNGSSSIITKGTLRPLTDNTNDLGISTRRYQDLFLAGTIYGGSTLTLDPAAHGDDTGTVVIAGNLQVDGTTTTINSTTLTVDDKNITLASGSTNAAAANGAGITVDCGSDTDATFSYQDTGDRWTLNKPLHWTYATATTALSLNNNNIVGVNNIAFADPGNNEGLQWSNIRVFEAPNDLSNTSGNLQVTYGGTRRLTVNNAGASINGNLGVGTDSPISKVDVLGDGKFRGTADATAVLKLGQHDNSATTPLVTVYTDDLGSTRPLGGDALEFNMSRYGQVIGATRGSAAGGNVRSWKFTTSTNSNERGVDLILYSQGDSSATGSTGTSGNVQLSATSNRNSYINTSGNFGLGTNAPTHKLHVASTSPSLLLQKSDETGRQTNISHSSGLTKIRSRNNSTNGQITFEGYTSSTTTEYARFDASGNLGIGTSNPSEKLDIESAGSVNLEMNNTGNSVSLKLGAQSTAARLTAGPGDRLGLGAGNTADYMTIASDGDVGIGTTSPGSKLSIHSALDDYSTTHPHAANSTLELRDTRAVAAGNGASIVLTGIYTSGGSHLGNAPYIKAYKVNSTDGNYSFGLKFATRQNGVSAQAVAMTIDDQQRVGIGTTAPSQKLEVAGNAIISGSSSNGSNVALNIGGTGNSAIRTRHIEGKDYQSASTGDLYLNHYHNGNIIMNNGGGNLGMGTSSPARQIHVKDTNYNVARLERDGAGGGVALEFKNGDGNIWQVSNDGDEVLRFYYASNNRFQVTSTGAATFNNAFTFPTSDGQANQILKTDGSGNVSWATEAAVSASTSMSDADGDTKIQVEESTDEDKIRFDTAGTQRMIITNAGDVGIGTNSPSQKLQVAGTVLADTALAASSGTTSVGIGPESSINDTSSTYKTKLITENNNAKLTTYQYGSYLTLKAGVDGTNYANNWSKIELRDGGGTGSNNAHMKFYTHGDERMVIDNDGNIGIGDTTPEQKLTVRGATTLSVGDSSTGHGTEFNWVKSNTGSSGNGVWYKVADISLPSASYSAMSFEAYYETGLNNFGSHNYLDVREVFVSIVRNSTTSTNDSPDSATLRGRTSDIRVYKTAAGTYELQARHNSQNAKYAVRVRVFQTNGGTITPKMDGSTPGTTSGGTEYTVSEPGTTEGVRRYLADIDSSRIHLGNVDLYPSGNSAYVHLSASGLLPPDTTASNNGSLGTSTYLWNGVFSRRFQGEVGTAGAPTFTFVDDSNTGMYDEWYVQADGKRQLSLSVDGVRRMHLNEAGIWSAGNFYLPATGASLRSFHTYTEISNGTSGNGFRMRNSADGVDSLIVTSAGNGTFAGSLTVNGNIDLNGSNITDVNQINGNGGSGWLDFDMDTDNLYPQSPADNQTVLGSITHMNFVGDSNGNGTGGRFYWGYGVNSADSGTFTQTMDLDRSGNLTLTGALRGPATFTIDPATHGNDTGTVVIAGNLQVDGTTTTINSTTLTVDDLNITLASGATNAAAANGAGITVDCGSGTDATLTYNGTLDTWEFNKRVDVTSEVRLFRSDGTRSGSLLHNTSGTVLRTNSNGDNLYLQTAGTGNVYLQPSTAGYSTVVNEDGIDSDFRVESDGNTHAFFVDAGNSRLGINTSSLTADGLIIGTTNSNCELDLHNTGGSGTRWRFNSSAYGHLQVENKTDGIIPLTIRDNGRVGIGTTNPGRQLTVQGTSDAYIKTDATSHTSWTIGSDTYGFLIYDDDVGGTDGYRIVVRQNSGNVGVGTTQPQAKFQVEEAGIETTTTSTTATTQVAIDSFQASAFRSARYTIQVTNSTDSTYHLTEVLLIHNGTTPQITEYGTIFTGSAEATFDADISSGNVRLLATPATADSMTFKVVRHCITV